MSRRFRLLALLTALIVVASILIVLRYRRLAAEDVPAAELVATWVLHPRFQRAYRVILGATGPVLPLKTRLQFDTGRGIPEEQCAEAPCTACRFPGALHESETYDNLETKDGSRGYEADLLGFLQAKEGKMTRFDIVAHGQFWGHGAYTPGAPKGRFPLAISFTLGDVNDPLYNLVPDAVRCYADYLR